MDEDRVKEARRVMRHGGVLPPVTLDEPKPLSDAEVAWKALASAYDAGARAGTRDMREQARTVYEHLMGGTDTGPWHSGACYRGMQDEKPCSCGLDDARKLLRTMW